MIPSLLISDAYKQSHPVQYPEGTQYVCSNWTPRSDKYATFKDSIVVFGIQATIMKIEKHFNENFFNKHLMEAIEEFKLGYTSYFGESPDTSRLVELHQYGKLPIKIMALEEGTVCPIGVPVMTIINTKPEFFWFTNFLETILSTELWLPMTSATIAHGYRNILEKWSYITCDNDDHIDWQGHDFSMRGMGGLEASMSSGAGHLTSFLGSDTIPAVYYLQEYYGAKLDSETITAMSIPATEHSVMSMGTREDELGTFRRLITETYPKGLVSIVSDTWDLWKVLTKYLPQLKDEVMSRDGKVVIRPDSGNPADIICGLNTSSRIKTWDDDEPRAKGVIQLLWDIFGGTINEQGFKVLDPHIGAIYGDSITPEIAQDICRRLFDIGFASSNVVFGIGSYTYQFNTRDTYGFAMKATWGVVNGEPREIYKDPITDDGTKKSLRGLIAVYYDDEDGYYVEDRVSEDDAFNNPKNELKVIYEDGKFLSLTTINEIRNKLK